MEFENESLISVKLFTKYERYQMGTSTISLPSRFSRYELSRLVNEALELEKPIPFDFIIQGRLLRESLSEYISKHNFSSETTIELEYVPIIGKPQESSSDNLPDWVSSISNCEDGYVAGCYDGSIHVYGKDDKCIVNKQIHKKPIKCVDYKKVDSIPYICSVSLDNTLHVIQMNDESINEIAVCSGHDSHVLSCSINPNNGYIISGAWNGSVCIWDTKKLSNTEENEPIHMLSESLQGISTVTWWNDNPITAGWDHVIRIWDLETEGMISDMKGNKVINSIAVNEEKRVLGSGHPDGSVRLWDSRQEKSNIQTFASRHVFVSQVAWHPVNTNLISAVDYDGSITIYDIRSTFPLHIAENVHKGKMFTGIWKDENIMLTGGEDNKLKRFSVQRE